MVQARLHGGPKDGVRIPLSQMRQKLNLFGHRYVRSLVVMDDSCCGVAEYVRYDYRGEHG